MAYLFDNDSSSSSDHDNFDYASVANPFMRRKKANVVNEVIYVEEDDYVDKGKKRLFLSMMKMIVMIIVGKRMIIQVLEEVNGKMIMIMLMLGKQYMIFLFQI